MVFHVGEAVIYPRHGAATITKLLPDPFMEGQTNWSSRYTTEQRYKTEQRASTVLDEVFAS